MKKNIALFSMCFGLSVEGVTIQETETIQPTFQQECAKEDYDNLSKILAQFEIVSK